MHRLADELERKWTKIWSAFYKEMIDVIKESWFMMQQKDKIVMVITNSSSQNRS